MAQNGKKSGGFDMDEEALTRPKGTKRFAKSAPKSAPASTPTVAPEDLPPGVTPELMQAVLKAQEIAKKKPKKPQGPRFNGPAVTVNAQGLLRLNPKAAGLTEQQKKLGRSRFEAKASFDQLLGGQPSSQKAEEAEVSVVTASAALPAYDGVTPDPAVMSTDPWKAVLGPAQSREGQRSAEAYLKVLDQFAVGHNPRYEADAPGKIRAHIFACDVTRAMSCELPRYQGAREMPMGLLVDYLRSEGPMKGWRRLNPQEAMEWALEGHPVIAIPREPRVKGLALLRPVPPGPDGLPRFSAAGPKRGNDLTLKEALGVFAAEYFGHP